MQVLGLNVVMCIFLAWVSAQQEERPFPLFVFAPSLADSVRNIFALSPRERDGWIDR